MPSHGPGLVLGASPLHKQNVLGQFNSGWPLTAPGAPAPHTTTAATATWHNSFLSVLKFRSCRRFKLVPGIYFLSEPFLSLFWGSTMILGGSALKRCKNTRTRRCYSPPAMPISNHFALVSGFSLSHVRICLTSSQKWETISWCLLDAMITLTATNCDQICHIWNYQHKSKSWFQKVWFHNFYLLWVWRDTWLQVSEGDESLEPRATMPSAKNQMKWFTLVRFLASMASCTCSCPCIGGNAVARSNFTGIRGPMVTHGRIFEVSDLTTESLQDHLQRFNFLRKRLLYRWCYSEAVNVAWIAGAASYEVTWQLKSLCLGQLE